MKSNVDLRVILGAMDPATRRKPRKAIRKFKVVTVVWGICDHHSLCINVMFFLSQIKMSYPSWNQLHFLTRKKELKTREIEVG